ncbi:MAG: hypothetical protein EXS36_05770 [Pedosphaera sp.]|nr:hypothetical protein [Pedosphaera sp.]
MTSSPPKHRVSKRNWLSSRLVAACSLATVTTSLFSADLAGPVSEKSELKPSPRSAKPESVPPPISTTFVNLDVGSPELAGSASPVGKGWDITAGGADIWNKTDPLQ